MPDRIAMKITEEYLAAVSELMGVPADVFGEKTYMVITIIGIEDLEFNIKFVNEDTIFEEVKRDSSMQILAL